MTREQRPRRGDTVIELAAVSVGVPTVLATVRGDNVWSGIRKRPVDPSAVLWLSTLNLSGDGQADLTVHGGPDKAVYAYASEHLVEWAAELGELTDDAPFGENLSTRGVREDDVAIGDVWRWDTAVLQVCQPRWPCFKLALHRQRADIQARMRATGRTGWYLRVLGPGEVTVGSPIELVDRDPARLTIAEAHVAMGDRHLERPALVAALAAHEALAEEWRAPLRQRLGRA